MILFKNIVIICFFLLWPVFNCFALLFLIRYGEYIGTFTDSSLVGPYLFSTEVSATSPAGNHLTRFRQFTGLIFYPHKTGAGGQCPGDGKDDCKAAKDLIRRLSEIIERCCKSTAEPEEIK